MQHVLYLGGQKKGCVEILIDKPLSDPRFAAFIDPSVCKLAHVTYDAKRSVTGDLQPGEGTRHMLRTAFEIIKTKFHLYLGHNPYLPIITRLSQMTCETVGDSFSTIIMT